MLVQAILYLFIIQHAIAETYNTCKVNIPTVGYSITKYYRDKCVHCQSITPKIKKIVDSMERKSHPVTLYNVDTVACHEETQDIEVIPRVEVHKNGQQLLEFSGDMPYEKIVDLIVSKTGLSKDIFEPEVTAPQELLTVAKQDFLSPFSGPWIVYFDNGYDHVIEEILLETYKLFRSEIKIARYVGSDKEIVAGRYYIYDFPGLLVMYDGILMRYNGEMTLSAFHEFCSKLVEPSFKDITATGLTSVTQPTFVVFYSDVMLANRAFRRIAHDLKMNALTFKMKIETTEPEPLLRLAVFKNGSKFYYDGDINNEGEIREWLFHAHFPNISKLGMDNFYSIFHGLKPVVSIITDANSKDLSIFEDIALEHNRGVSASPYIFSFIDKTEYPKFTETNFGALGADSLITFFDPEKQTFFGHRRKPTESIQAYFETQLAQYKDGTLPKYIKPKPVSYKMLALGLCALAAVGGVVKLVLSTKKQKSSLE